MLEVTGLEVVYHGVVKTVSGLSLTVPERGVVALLGPNGAGKTTTLRAITGLLPLHEGAITKGSIRLGGTDLTGKRPETIVRNGLLQVMEGRRIFIELTVEENLLAGTYSRRDDWKPDLAAMYERFPRLAERRHQTAGLLSGGEQQMLAIGRALLAKPKVLLLDEPSLGLSPLMQDEVFAEVRRIAGSGVTVLIVEQNVHGALLISDTAIVLETGRKFMEGPARAVALHGYTGSGSDWAALAPALGVDLLAPDLPGHGRSEGGLAFSEAVDRLAHLAVASDFGACAWIGYSMGGRLALAAAIAHPERVRALVLLGAGLGIEDAAERARRREADEVWARTLERDGLEAFLARWDAQPLFAGRPARLAPSPHAAAGLADAMRRLGQGAQPPLAAALDRVRCPALLLAGERDTKYADLAGRMADAMPDARVEIIPSAGHAAHQEAPAAFAETARRFLLETEVLSHAT